jgi:hypothetical protein
MAAKVSTVNEYLRSLASNDRVIVNQVRDLIASNVADGFVETLAWGFPTFQVPLDRATATYDGEPMVFAAIAAEKRRYALYLTALYNDSPAELEFRTRWRSPSHRMVDLGAGCLRFRALKDLDLGLIAEVLGSMNVDEFIASYHRSKDS